MEEDVDKEVDEEVDDGGDSVEVVFGIEVVGKVADVEIVVVVVLGLKVVDVVSSLSQIPFESISKQQILPKRI